MREKWYVIPLPGLAAVVLWSALGPTGWLVWWMEALPALLAVALLAVTYRKFRFTPLVYGLVWLHCAILLVGAHYTYECVPLFDWIREAFGQARNNYDKLGHFAQGFVPALVARELLLRTSGLARGKWMFALVALAILGVSAIYELIEWWAAVALGETADSFLGTQGDIWDAQKDMLCALAGAICALVTLSRLQDRQLRKMGIAN
jgi:putative membrane protein